MSDNTTMARPYAKAVFEHVLFEKQLALWSEYLAVLAQAVENDHAFAFIRSPASTIEQQVDLLKSVYCSKMKENESVNNLLILLATKKRLLLLPAIKELYEAHKAEQEKTLDVLVVSFSMPPAAQQEQIRAALNQRMQREVSLTIRIDPSLLGGAIIRAGDLVIDGSIRGKLNKLNTDLAA